MFRKERLLSEQNIWWEENILKWYEAVKVVMFDKYSQSSDKFLTVLGIGLTIDFPLNVYCFSQASLISW